MDGRQKDHGEVGRSPGPHIHYIHKHPLGVSTQWWVTVRKCIITFPPAFSCMNTETYMCR